MFNFIKFGCKFIRLGCGEIPRQTGRGFVTADTQRVKEGACQPFGKDV